MVLASFGKSLCVCMDDGLGFLAWQLATNWLKVRGCGRILTGPDISPKEQPTVSRRKESRKQHLEGPRLDTDLHGPSQDPEMLWGPQASRKFRPSGPEGKGWLRGRGEKGRQKMRVSGSISILLLCKKKKKQDEEFLFLKRTQTCPPPKKKKAKCTERHLEIGLNECL